MMETDFPELPCVVEEVETALSDGGSDFERVFLEQDSESDEGGDLSSLSRINSFGSEKEPWNN